MLRVPVVCCGTPRSVKTSLTGGPSVARNAVRVAGQVLKRAHLVR